MMNHHHAQPSPGPACAAVAPLVALVVGQRRLSRQDAHTLQAHLETCAYCQAELDSYWRLDEALACHFAPPDSDPLSPDEISAIIDQTAHPPVRSFARPARPTSRSARRPLAPPSAPSKPRGHRFISTLSALAAVVLIAAVGLALFISHASQPGRSTKPTPTPGIRYFPQANDNLSGVSMVSASDGWAVGSRLVSIKVRDTLILHYNGSYWEQISSPTHQDLQALFLSLGQVAMVSPTEGWATGTFTSSTGQGSFGFILHYTGGRWIVQQKFPDMGLSGLAMLSASDGWAVGSRDSIQQGVLLHYTGGVWRQVNPFGATLDRIAMTSPDDGWIVGTLPSGASAVWYYNGSAWTSVNVPVMPTVNSIAPISASDAWAVGFNPDVQKPVPGGGAHGGYEPIFAHYDGRTWTTIQTPVSGMKYGEITNLTMDAANDGWAFGTQPASGGAAATTNLYLHYTGGQWREVDGPAIDEVLTVSMVSASEGWAVGDSGAILHYHAGSWNLVVFP